MPNLNADEYDFNPKGKAQGAKPTSQESAVNPIAMPPVTSQSNNMRMQAAEEFEDAPRGPLPGSAVSAGKLRAGRTSGSSSVPS